MYSKSPNTSHLHRHDDTRTDLSSLDHQHSRIHHKGQYFYEKLMEKYGENGMLTLGGLEKILQNIGAKDVGGQHQEGEESYHHKNNPSLKRHDSRGKSRRHGSQGKRQRHADTDIKEKRNHSGYINDTSFTNTLCMNDSSELLMMYIHDESIKLNKDDFKDICSGIVVLLDKTSCNGKSQSLHHGRHECEVHHQHSDADSLLQRRHSIENISVEVWGYSIAAVLIISLVGLLGVAVIPIMQKVLYNHLLQFLVALAVGALSGDAMLHLFPHAFAGDQHQHESSNAIDYKAATVLKGLCGLVSLYVFFVMERLVVIFTCVRRKTTNKKPSLRMDMDPSQHHCDVKSSLPDSPTEPDCETMTLHLHPCGKVLDKYAKESELLMSKSHDHKSRDTSLDAHKVEEENEVVLGSKHSHPHSHSKSVSNSVFSIAWMVILGDGIHNFSDGVAIGAAFSNSVTSGLSTSIAVFCHELPHEIGDFAVLLQAGMTVKQAIVYNCVSSALAFFGMLTGVMIGNVGDASLWVFAITGGIFLYIAFVDMLPEMTAVGTRRGENPFCHLLLQTAGMLLGAGIMFVIAMYETQLMTVMGP